MMDLQVLFSLIGIVFVVLSVVLTAIRPKTGLHGPTPLPLVGNALLFTNPKKLKKIGLQLQEQYGDIFRVYLGPYLIVVVSAPDDIKKVFGSSTDRGNEFTSFLRTTFGDGLFSNSGEKWRRHQKIIAPTFHPQVLETFLYSFNQHSAQFAERLKKKCGNQFNILPNLIMFSFAIVTETVMGADGEECATRMKKVSLSTLSRIFYLFTRRVARPWLLSDRLYALTIEGKEFLKLKWEIESEFSELVMKRVNEGSRETMISDSPRRQAFVDLILNSGEELPLTTNEIREEAFTLVSAGFETTSKSLGFTLALLGLHQEWQDAVHKELDEIFGGTGEDYHRPVSLEDLSKMKILESCIKESLRLFPIVPIIPRKLHSDVKLGPDDENVPKGSIVLGLCYFTHRLEKYFPNPHNFDPTRFMSATAAERHTHSYYPFGAGPRNCIGSRYFMMLAKTSLATLLRKFKVQSHSSFADLHNFKVSISITPEKGFPVELEERNIDSSYF